MFNLYSYENMLYVMSLSGREIKGFLEYSYSKWVVEANNDSEHVFFLKKNDDGRYMFVNQTFNYESAAGINYTVDITKPIGQKVSILSSSDGRPFDLEKIYKVAINSYRGNGGGNLLTAGAGIPKNELSSRIVSSTDKDLRFYLMQYIMDTKQIDVPKLDNWKFIPENLFIKTSTSDRRLLFGE